MQAHKGQYLFIEVWASWCVPCVAKLPKNRIIEENWKGENLHFASLCVSSSETGFKTVLARSKVGGLHYFADKEAEADIKEKLFGDPKKHYLGGLLFDPEGQLLEEELHPDNPATLARIKIISSK